MKKRARPAAQEAKMKKVAMQAIRQTSEVKYGDIYSTQGESSAGTVSLLSGVTQRDTDSNREGDQLRITSVQIRGNVVVADATNIVRIVLLQWKSSIAAGPAVTDVLPNGTGPSVYAPYAHDNRDNMRILWDSGLICVDTYNPIKEFSCMVTKGFLNDRKIQYVAGSATTGYPHLFLCVVSDSTAVTHPPRS